MARHKTTAQAEPSEPDLDISSLIDICFLLLIYFLVSMTIVPREQDLGMSLPVPGSENPLVSRIEPLFIRIDDSGAIFTGTGLAEQAMDSNPESRDLPLLSSQLQLYADAARASMDTPLVQILVGNGTSQQRVVDVLNALASQKITAVTFTDLVEM